MAENTPRGREQDPVLRAALHAHFGMPPDEVDWPAFHQRLVAGARARLARRPAPPPWWLYVSQWAGPAVPVGVAASLLIAMGLGLFGGNRGATGNTAMADDPVVVEEVLASAAGDALAVEPLLAADEAAFVSLMLDVEE
ncbi:MAG: hypothetical protein H0T44_03010 [Gemmatimonadales bacterium]|nr:hypothetical protein [Gemmatimonadales bacterium]MDQ3426588.1 hypothetical protein [Gemmatimonadota bacterium]